MPSPLNQQDFPRDSASRQAQKPAGRLLVFLSAKGGAGSTTLATNFAVALAQKTDESTLLIDLDLPLGDAALSLGIVGENSTIDALEAGAQLDGESLKQLLVRHSAGVNVLPAPGRFLPCRVTGEGIDRLIAVARQSFDNVVVDAGSRLDLSASSLFHEADIVYLVTQAGVPELRNANRLIADYFSGAGARLQIVLNRFGPRAPGISEEHVTRALTRPPDWKVPNDYIAVREMQISAMPLVFAPSAIAATIRAMASAAIGAGMVETKKRGLGWFS
jgi:pilus assembly protein CpaE